MLNLSTEQKKMLLNALHNHRNREDVQKDKSLSKIASGLEMMVDLDYIVIKP
jgi:hypothetical protein